MTETATVTGTAGATMTETGESMTAAETRTDIPPAAGMTMTGGTGIGTVTGTVETAMEAGTTGATTVTAMTTGAETTAVAMTAHVTGRGAAEAGAAVMSTALQTVVLPLQMVLFRCPSASVGPLGGMYVLQATRDIRLCRPSTLACSTSPEPIARRLCPTLWA